MKIKQVGSLLILSAALCQGATCESLIQQGRNFLTASNVAMAHQSFSAAVGQCPNNGEANTLYAMTLLANWPSQPGPSNFLNRLGVPAEGRDIYHWTAFVPEDTNGMPLASSGVNANEAAALVRNDLLPVIQEARQRLALVTDTNFQMLVPERSTPYSRGVTMDYGDVVMLQSMLYAAEFFAYTVHSWNLDVQLTALRGLAVEGLLSIESVLAENPQLLTFATTNDFQASQIAFTNASATYMKASQIIRARPPASPMELDNRLFNFDPDEAQSEEQFRLTLADLTESLTHPVVLCTDSNYTVSLNNYFAAKHPLRSLLPRFYDNYVVVGTLPDTTFGGIIEGVSEVGLEYALSKSIPMRSLMQGLMQEPEQFMCSFSTLTGRVYSLDMSTDLVHWTQVSEFLSEGGTYGFMDGGSGAAQKRFYRLVDLEASYITIDGQVLDLCSGLPIAGAIVYSSASSRPSTTDANGRFHFQTRALTDRPLEFSVAAYADGYYPNSYSSTVSYHHKNGLINLTPLHPTAPANDNFSNRQPITGTEVTIAGHTCGGTTEPEESFYGYSVWYTWTPMVSGSARITPLFTLDPPWSDHGLRVYTGSSFMDLEWIENSDLYPEVWFDVTAGMTYQICVFSAGAGRFELVFSMPPTVDILNPVQDQVFRASRDPIFINLSASDPDGTIKDVKLYQQAPYWSEWVHLATLTQFPYAFVWTNAPLGDWSLIAVATDNASNTTSATTSIHVRPANDNFRDRIALTGSNVVASGSTAWATYERGEPSVDDGINSVWWAWTPPVEMDVTITTFTGSLDKHSCAFLGVYTGSQVDGLSLIMWNEEPWNYVSNFSRVSFHASANTQYQIGVDGYYGGDFFLSINPGLPPTVQVLTPVNADRFPAPGAIPLSAMASDPDGTIARVDFYLNSTLVGSDAESPFSFIANDVPPDYYNVYAAATDNSGFTTFAFGGLISVAPQNDDFTNRIVLTGSHVRTNFSNAGASAELGDPWFSGFWPYWSVWWSWTAPSNGNVTIRVESLSYGKALAIYTGAVLGELAEIASEVDPGYYTLQVTFPVTNGRAYQIMVDSAYGPAVQGELQLDFSPSP